jgi:hypothetical protein
MIPHQVEEAAKVIAAYELFDWNLLPESDSTAVRDREAFRTIARASLEAAHGGQ